MEYLVCVSHVEIDADQDNVVKSLHGTLGVVHDGSSFCSSTECRLLPLSKIHVSIEKDSIMFVLSLELASLVSRVGLEVAIQGELQTRSKLLIVHGGVDGVVSGPLLGQLDSMLLVGHLGLQTSIDLSSISGGVASSSELNATGRLGLDLQLDKTKVVTLAKHITGRLANVRVGWRSHYL